MLTIVFFSIITAAFSQTNTSDSLTIDEAVRMALATNPAIQQAAHAIDASKARVEESESSLYPEAGVSLNYTRLGPVAAFSFPGFGSINLFPSNNYDEHVGVSATVYDFNKRQKSIDLVKTQVQSSKDRLELVRQDLAYRTVQTFYTILFLKQSIQVQNDEINTLNEHLNMTRKKVEAGTATDFDVLTTQVRVAAAQNTKISLENSLANAEITLRHLLGLPPNARVEPAGEFTEAPVPLNLDSLINVAMQNRVEVKAADDQIVSAQAQYNVASAVNNPSVNIALAYGFKNGYEPNINAWRGNYAAAVQLQIPLSGVVPYFGGYREESMQQEASANIKAAKSYKSDVAEQIKADVQRGVADLRSSMDKFQTTDVAVQQAESALSLAKIRYEAGTVTNLDLLDAETSLAQARLMRLEALYRYVIGRYELLQAVGEKIW